jgi:diguanylate cyclase (GGDEF)-like protein
VYHFFTCITFFLEKFFLFLYNAGVEQEKEHLPASNGIENEITRLIYAQLPVNVLAVFINASVIVFILRNVLSFTPLAIWYGVNVGLSLVRLGMSFFYKKQSHSAKHSQRFWRLLFNSGTLLAGLAFGSAGIFLFPPDNFAYQVFVYLVLGGMAAGSSGTYAVNKGIFLLYSIPVFFPGTIHFFSMGGEIRTAMGALGLLFYLILFITVLRMHKITINSLTLDFENFHLIEKLKKEKQQTEALNEELREMSLKDPMTGLQNRRFFLEIIKPEAVSFSTQLSFASKETEKRKDSFTPIYGVFLIDIDHFKRVNDTYGHDSGDTVLKQFSRILNQSVRAEDLIVRWGGEEFLVILRRAETGQLFTFAERVRQTVANTGFKIAGNETENETISKTCSIGFTSYPFNSFQPAALTVEQSITLADRALYFAKNQGRDLSAGVFAREDIDLDTKTVTAILDTFHAAAADGLIRLKTWGR